MAEIKQKIDALKKKILARENKLAKLDKRIYDSKREYKAVAKEIDELNDDIRKLELERLSVTLEQNGITADDVAAAIADGSIKKTTSETEIADLTKNDNSVSGEDANGATYITQKTGESEVGK